MRRISLLSVLALTVLFVALSSGGCKKIQRMLPARTIDNPDPGSPEMVIRQAIEAAQEKDEPTGWKKFRALLHSEQLSEASLKSWRTLNFQSFRRKVNLLTPEDGKPIYKIDYEEDYDRDGKKIYVVNEKSDMPMPFPLKPDPAAGGAWKIGGSIN